MVRAKNLSVSIVLLALGLGIIFIGVTGKVSFFAITPFDNPLLESKMVGKFGVLETSTPFKDFGDIVDNTYGYIIFETPIKVLGEGVSIGDPFRSTILTSLIERNSFTAFQLNTLEKGVEDEIRIMCDSVPDDIVSANDASLKSFCDKKNDVIIKDGRKRVIVLPDVDEFKVEYETDCAPSGVDPAPLCQIINTKVVPTGNKMRLSNLEMEVYEKGSHIVLAYGKKGIAEAEALPTVFTFEQLGFSINSEECIDIDIFSSDDLIFSEAGDGFCTVLSNSQGLIDASNGEIEKISRFSDVINAIKTGKITRSTSVVETAGLTFLGLIMAGVGLVFLIITVRKKS